MILGPLKAGFKLGRSGTRVSPLPDWLEPTCGVTGKPLNNVTMAFNCQPLASLPAAPVAPASHGFPFPKGNREGNVTVARRVGITHPGLSHIQRPSEKEHRGLLSRPAIDR